MLHSAGATVHIAQKRNRFVSRLPVLHVPLASKERLDPRKPAQSKYIKASFCTDVYRRHLTIEHEERWKQYHDAHDAIEKSFLKEQLSVKETLQKYIGTKQIEKIFLISVLMLDVIIGKMQWDPEDIDGQMHARTMACYENVA